MADTNVSVDQNTTAVAPTTVVASPAAVVPIEAAAVTPAEAIAPAVVAPIDYSKLKLDKSALSNTGMVDRVTAYAKENSLGVEQAQKLLDSMSTEVKAYTDAKNTEWQTMTEGWVNDVRADTELGGMKFDQAMSVAKKVVHRFATPELVEQLDATGFGNHPELVRLLYRIGQTMKEDTLILPGANIAPQKDMSSILYDHPSSNTST